MKTREALLITLNDLKKVLTDTDGCLFDALGEYITRYNSLSGHHIHPVRKGGRTCPQNIIPLSEITHPQFNHIEQKCPSQARVINEGFLDLLATHDPTIIPELKAMKDYLLDEYEYDNDKRFYISTRAPYKGKSYKRGINYHR